MTFYTTVAEVQRKTGDTVSPQPFLRMVQLAVTKILQIETDQSIIDTLKETFSQLRKEEPESLRQQKDKYDLLGEQCKEKKFEDEAMKIIYEVGVDTGISYHTNKLQGTVHLFVGLYFSKHQKPNVPGLRSKKDPEANYVKIFKRLNENWKFVLVEGVLDFGLISESFVTYNNLQNIS